MTKKIFKILAYFIAIICLFLIALYGFVQSKYFKERLRVILISELSQSLDSEFYLGTIKGNYFVGFYIDSVSIYKDDEKFLSVKGIKLSYDPLTVIGKKITLKKITVENFDLRLLKARDSVWNFNKIFKPSSKESKPFDWTIEIKDFSILSGRFLLYDSTKVSYKHPRDSITKYLDYHHLMVENIKLYLSGYFKERYYKLKVKEIQLSIPDISFNLKKFAVDLSLNKNDIKIDNLFVETDSSSVKIDAALSKLDIFQKISLSDFEDKPVKLRFIAHQFNLNEFKRFLPAVYFLNGNAFADVDADGFFGNLRINSLNLKTLDSYIRLDGHVLNLHRPKELLLDVRVNNSEILPGDVSKLLPPFKIPTFNGVKSVILNANYYGTPLDFTSKIYLSSKTLGSATVDLKLNLTDTLIKYDAVLRTMNLDLESLTQNSLLKSNLNTSLTIKGKGVKIDNLDTKLILNCDSSSISNLNVESLRMMLSVIDKKLETDLILNSDAGEVVARGKLNLVAMHSPIYEVDAKFSSLNLSKITNDEKRKSRLNFDVHSLIEGKKLDQMNAQIRIDLKRSEIANNIIENEEINIKLDQKELENKVLKVSSSSFDFGLNGKFNLESTPRIFSGLVRNVVNEIYKRIDNEIFTSEADNSDKDLEPEDFNFTCKFIAKDLNVISKLFFDIPFNFNGEGLGNFGYHNDNLIAQTNIKINDLFFGKESSGILISNATLNFNLEPINRSNPLEESSISISLAAEEINFNSVNILGTNLKLSYNKASGTVEVNSQFGESKHFHTRFNLYTKPEHFRFVSDLFNLTFQNYSINADSIMSFVVDEVGVKVENLVLLSSDGERLFLNGSLNNDNTIKFYSRINHFLFKNLQFIGMSTEGLGKISGDADVNMMVEGTLSEPIINCQIILDSLSYKNSNFGKLNGLLTYDKKKLNISIVALNPELVSETILSVSGVIPIDLALVQVENRIPDERVYLKIKTDGFPLAILNPLIPYIDNLSGKVICDLQIGGTTTKPNYFGKIDLKDVKFLLLTNYVNYNVTGSLVSDYDKINLVDFYIKNDRSDFVDGLLNLSGFFTIREYKFDNFSLKAKGQLLLLKEGIRRKMQNLYGKLVATTEEEGVSFQGTISSSNISGAIIIKEANLIFPPSQNQIYTDTDNLIRYVGINDTLIEVIKRDIKKEYYFSDKNNRNLYWTEEVPTSSKFLNGLTYDLVLSTRGTTNIRMIFNPATNEELYAELDGKVYIQRYSNRNYFIGEISISERSYYNFFKKFEATGKLKFIGDPNNPELDIKATYTGTRQVQASLHDTAFIEQKVVIGLDITGTRLEPNLKMSIKIDEKDYNDVIQSGDLQSDAISFLFTGKFKDDLTNKEKSDIISGIGTTAGKSLIAGATSTMLSGILTDFLRKEFGFIRTAEVTYAGGSLQQSADLRLSGQIFNAYWRFGGKIFDDINNANVSFILNFGDVFNSPKVKNFYLELERRVDGREYNLDKKLTNSAKIYYKWSF